MKDLFRNAEENTLNQPEESAEAPQAPQFPEFPQDGQRPPMPPQGFPGGQMPQGFPGQPQTAEEQEENSGLTEGFETGEVTEV